MGSQPIQSLQKRGQSGANPTASLIAMRGIEKRYGSLLALRGVDFDVRPGEVHGLLGQNGAGKTTLIKIIAGIETPTAGDFRINGDPVRLAGVADSKSRGISVVHQALSLVPTLTVAENMYLGSEARRAGVFLDRKTTNELADQLLAHYGIPLHPKQQAGSLTFAYRQLLEIAKALVVDAKVLILDEPTSSLSKAEEPILFNAVREVTRKGIGVVYVSHRLSEVLELTDRVTVLRDGANVASLTTRGTTVRQLAEAIIGGATPVVQSADLVAPSEPSAARDVVLELRDVRSRGVNGATLTVRAGDVVGLVGTTGSGRTEILETVFGIRPMVSGDILHRGVRFRPKSPREAIRRSIKLVPEDRHEWGLVLDHDIEHNIAMANLPQWTRWHGFFRAEDSRARAEEMRNRLSIKATSVDVRLDRLSGGNQQKVVIGKWLVGDTDVLLLDEPTAGVDVGARADIYSIILELARKGTAVLVSSSDYDELMQLCSSFAFVTRGHISGFAERAAVRDERQLHEMLDSYRKGSAA